METGKSEKPPADIIKRNFQPVNKIFDKNNLHFADSIKSFWIKVHLANTLSSDTSIALIFPQNVSKAVLYKTEGDSLILIGKAGFFHCCFEKKYFIRGIPDRHGIKSQFKNNLPYSGFTISWNLDA
jgi:hypothetical protein